MHIGSGFQNFQRCGIHPLLPGNQRSKAVHLDKVLDAGRIRRVICNHMQSKVIQFCHVLFPLSSCYKSSICLYCTAPPYKSKGQFSFLGSIVIVFRAFNHAGVQPAGQTLHLSIGDASGIR